MPELPEVETTRIGLAAHIEKQQVKGLIIRQRQLRYPIPKSLDRQLPGQIIQTVTRRGKYLLVNCAAGHMIVHLGMSGCIRVVNAETKAAKHDHVDIIFTNGHVMRYNDPRRFGAILWSNDDPHNHPRLCSLGVEPLSRAFNTAYLHHASRSRRLAIKLFIMDSKVVVGVGNIYANEALFLAGIKPTRPANTLSREQYESLVSAIKQVLKAAIKCGGTTLKDFQSSDGKPGYFQQQLHVYGRGQQKCLQCHTRLTEIRLGQRSSVYCDHCQR